MRLPEIGLGGHSREEGHSREGGQQRQGHEEALAPPYRGQRVVLGPQEEGPQQGATSGGHELQQAAGANVGDDAGATIHLDGGRGHEGLPAAELAGEQMALGERLKVALRYWLTEAWATFRARATKPGSLYHTQPESLAQHDERIARHEWVPEGYEGKWLAHLGVAYHQSFGKFGMVTGYAWKWLWDTPLAFFPVSISFLIAVILIRYA